MSTIRRLPRLQAARQFSTLTLAGAAITTPALAFSLSWLDYGGSGVPVAEASSETEPADEQPAEEQAAEEQTDDTEASADEPSSEPDPATDGDAPDEAADDEVAAHEDQTDPADESPVPTVADDPLPGVEPAGLVPSLLADVELPADLLGGDDDEAPAEEAPAEEAPADDDQDATGDEPVEPEPDATDDGQADTTWRFEVLGATLDTVTLAAGALDVGTVVEVRDLAGRLVATGTVAQLADGSRVAEIPLGVGVYEAGLADGTEVTPFAVAAPASLLS